ncbi:MAG: ABC transporter substrate-binding protein [Gammaproteobacteria bacterium]|nr:ABC transporter substrate-binding protein [Gammaproteobacteria bacterium]
MTLRPLMETARFHDLLCEGKLNRRDAHRVMATFGIGTLTAHTLGGGALAQEADEDHPIFFTWGGYDEPEFMVHYTAKYGREPNYHLFASEDEAFAKMWGGFEPHVTYPCGPSLALWYDAGLLAPIETDRLSNWPDVMQVFKDVADSVVDGVRVYVPEDWGQTSMVIRTDLAPEYADPANQTWEALWNEKYAGRLSISNHSYEAFAIAALVLGISPWNMNEAERIQCEDLLRKQIPLNRVIGASFTERVQAVAAGELVISTNDNGAVAELAAHAEGTSFEFTWATPREGAITWHCGLCIHPAAITDGFYEKAHEIIDSFISPEAGAYEIGNWYYGHSNVKSYDGFTEEFLNSIGQTKYVEAFLATAQFQQTMNEPDVLATRWEELKAGF